MFVVVWPRWDHGRTSGLELIKGSFIHIYISIYLYIYISIYLYIYTYLYLCTCTCTCTVRLYTLSEFLVLSGLQFEGRTLQGARVTSQAKFMCSLDQAFWISGLGLSGLTFRAF